VTLNPLDLLTACEVVTTGGVCCDRVASWMTVMSCSRCSVEAEERVLWCSEHLSAVIAGRAHFTCTGGPEPVTFPYEEIIQRVERL
jgi:hypothetical protein